MTPRERKIIKYGRQPILWTGGNGIFEDVRDFDCIKSLAARGLVKTVNGNDHFFVTTKAGWEALAETNK